MAMKRSYKQTEVGIIPKDWNVVPLGDIGECIIGLTYSPDDVSDDGRLVLRSSNIADARLAFDDNVYVTRHIPEQLILRENDILVCVRNGSRNLIGKAALIDRSAVGMTFGAFMSVFRTAYSKYVFYQFQSALIARQINANIGATINQITNANLNSFLIPLPPHAEQRRITEVLYDIDAQIAALDELIAKKRAVKQGVIQEMLTGRRRLQGFSREWGKYKLGELGTFAKGSGIKKDDVIVNGYPCIRYGEIYTHHNDLIRNFYSYISSEIALSSYRLRAGDLLFAGTGETADEIGKCVAFLSSQEVYAGGDIVVFSSRAGDSTYLAYLMNTRQVASQKAKLAQGDAVVHISATSLAALELVLPDQDEQIAIAAVIVDMDDEIAALEAQRRKAADLKQAMMQELLTGKTRLI